jgi:hypothetical protein
MVVSLAILAAAVSVSLRLLFTMDRVVGSEEQHLTRTAGRAQLLADLGADVRAARGVAATGATLRLQGSAQVRYYWDAREQATIRRASTPERETTIYPGARATFRPAGTMVRVRLRSADADVRTAYYLRNQ